MIVNLRLWPLYLLAIVVSFHSCTCSKQVVQTKPVRIDETPDKNLPGIRFAADEILIVYKGTPTAAKRDTIRKALVDAGINIDSLTIKTCNSCASYVELWQAHDIHTVISGEGIVAGTVSGGTRGVGEDTTAIYSLNYYQYLPVEQLPTIRQYKFNQLPEALPGTGKDTIIVAVLDTGVDTVHVVKGKYLWKNRGELSISAGDADANCYTDDIYGWNFVEGSADVRDNNISLHGTIISQYIVEEFSGSANNFLQLMTLKTHDGSGKGDLFSAICALHYAMDKGANIINASWGFYSYEDKTHPYLDSLITKVLPSKGILFITAAGNKIDQVDQYAKDAYQNANGTILPDSLLRNLEIHNFYPAILADKTNSVIVATTTDGNHVSPTQNYAARYVDAGVMADSVTGTSMKFSIPFTSSPVYISGSSFATAIVTGKIGAMTARSRFAPGLNKQDILNDLDGAPGIITKSPNLENRKYIRNGRYMKRK